MAAVEVVAEWTSTILLILVELVQAGAGNESSGMRHYEDENNQREYMLSLLQKCSTEAQKLPPFVENMYSSGLNPKDANMLLAKMRLIESKIPIEMIPQKDERKIYRGSTGWGSIY
jgi:hypothetical protein